MNIRGSCGPLGWSPREAPEARRRRLRWRCTTARRTALMRGRSRGLAAPTRRPSSGIIIEHSSGCECRGGIGGWVLGLGCLLAASAHFLVKHLVRATWRCNSHSLTPRAWRCASGDSSYSRDAQAAKSLRGRTCGSRRRRHADGRARGWRGRLTPDSKCRPNAARNQRKWQRCCSTLLNAPPWEPRLVRRDSMSDECMCPFGRFATPVAWALMCNSGAKKRRHWVAVVVFLAVIR